MNETVNIILDMLGVTPGIEEIASIQRRNFIADDFSHFSSNARFLREKEERESSEEERENREGKACKKFGAEYESLAFFASLCFAL